MVSLFFYPYNKSPAKLTRTSRSLRTIRVSASCVPWYRRRRAAYPRRHALYVRGTRTSLGRAVRTAYRGTTGGGGPRAGRRRCAAVGARPRARARARAHAGAAAGGQGGGRRVTQAARGTQEQEEVMVFGRSEWVRPWRERRSTGPGPSHDSMHCGRCSAPVPTKCVLKYSRLCFSMVAHCSFNPPV